MKAPAVRKYSKPRGSRGFALVVTLGLFVLLVVISVGLLSLSTITLRAGTRGEDLHLARANARMALAMAIGRLQTLAGPDMRATAPAAQLERTPAAGGPVDSDDVAQPHWIGVWPTTVEKSGESSFIVGRHGKSPSSDRSNYLMDLRNGSTENWGDKKFDEGRKEFDRKGKLGWLVSSPPDEEADPESFDNGDEERTRVLVGNRWAKESDDTLEKKIVRAPLVELEEGKSAFAWWVGDESQKANLALASPYDDDAPESLAVSQAAQGDLADKVLSGHGDLVRKSDSPLEQVPDFDTLGLLPLGADASKEMPRFIHDFTASSVGLLTSPQTGGFMQDFSAFLGRSEKISASTSFAGSSPFAKDADIGAPGLSFGTPMVYGTRNAATSPRFAALKAWADLGTEASSGTVKMALPPTSASHPYKGPDLTKVAVQPMHPVIAEFSVGFDFSPFSSTQPNRAIDRDGLRLHIYPRLVLWNPYNVAITAPPLLAIMRFDPRVTLSVRGETVQTPRYSPPYYAGHSSYPYLLSMVVPLESGNESLTQNCLGFTTEATVFPPGQALVFSPDISKGNRVVGGNASLYDPKGLNRNILTSKVPPGQDNFYADAPITEHFKGVPKTGNNATYGFQSYTSDVGMWYALKLPPSSGSSVTMASSGSLPTLQYIIPNARGTSYKIYEGLRNAMNTEGQPFTTYTGGTRHAQSTWRQGVRIRQFDERFEWDVRTADPQVTIGATPFAAPWTQYNLRGGHVHTAWLGPNVNYSDSNVGAPWEWNPGGNYLTIRGHRSNDDAAVQGVPNSSGQFTLPPFGTASDLGAVSSFAFYDVPNSKVPIASLARFQHTCLSYGNYQSGNAIAWSFQDPRSERQATVVRSGQAGKSTVNPQDDCAQSNRWFTEGHAALIQQGNGHSDDVLLYDLPFEANHRLFDNFFLSTIEYGSGGGNWDGVKPLTNARIRRLPGVSEEKMRDLLGDSTRAFHRAASLLGNYGAFNVNSTSVEAWTAHLSGLRGSSRKTHAGSSGNGSPYSRFDMPQASSTTGASNWQDPAAWSSSRELSDNEIRTLAEAIVEEVKIRGPFLSLSDFVNRRLVDPPANARSVTQETPEKFSLEATGRYGALDAAIRRAGLNAGLEDRGSGAIRERLAASEFPVTTDDLSKGYLPAGANPEFRTIGLPGYLSQGDLLSSLAPTLTARGDTFRIRAYGEARDAEKKIVARAWCEAIVQRTPGYLDISDEAALRPYVFASSNASQPFLKNNDELAEANRRFGRRFEVASFRWLNPDEV